MREYEHRGVCATEEMQSAARAVARENVRLRALLELRGIGHEEVEAFLSRPEHVDTEGHLNNESFGLGSRCVGFNERAAASGDSGAGSMRTQDSAAIPQRDDVSTRDRSGIEVTKICSRDDTNPGIRTGDISAHALEQVTSCNTAANMIAELQGHGDSTQARELLGCGSSKNCHVKNTQLFQLMVDTT